MYTRQHKKSAITIQRIWRGYITRKQLIQLKDTFSFKILKRSLSSYKDYVIETREISKKLRGKKYRAPNFPSEISENIVKFAIKKSKRICPTWNTKSGDLTLDLLTFEKKLEIKGFSSSGPSSFGPKSIWDIIYFIDCHDFMKDKFTVYEISLPNNNKHWMNLKMNSKQTYKQQCNQGRRPRISFKNIQLQLNKKYVKVIFTGNISQLQ